MAVNKNRGSRDDNRGRFRGPEKNRFSDFKAGEEHYPPEHEEPGEPGSRGQGPEQRPRAPLPEGRKK